MRELFDKIPLSIPLRNTDDYKVNIRNRSRQQGGDWFRDNMNA